MILLAWSFLLMSYVAGPWSSGGWYAVTVGPFRDRAMCEQVRDYAVVRGRERGQVMASACWPADP